AWPGPPAISIIVPRATPGAGSTSTCSEISPAVPPVRSSGAATVPHRRPLAPHGVNVGPASAGAGRTAHAATAAAVARNPRPPKPIPSQADGAGQSPKRGGYAPA